ncbi:MAG: GNAT family N-acetyltransferase [Deltaproteobacteria bacterium]|nr:GNAT family N-acetyltransferase [Deltaproteobacteria bacterium]
MDNLVIRKLKIEDIEAAGRVYNSIVQLPRRFDFHRELMEQCRSSCFVNFVAEIDSEIVGFLLSYVIYGGFGIDKSAWISLICVHPKFMDRGIGQNLAEDAFKIYKKIGIKNVHTSFEWDSVDLLSFFKNLGFGRSDFVNLRKIIK